MRKTIIILLFLCFQLVVQAQTTYRYWFDTDDASMQEGISNVDEWQLDIDVNDLTENIHQLHLQVADNDGTWSTIHTHWFVKAPSHASHGMYWFDENDKDIHRSDILNGRFDIDVSMLTDGIHILTYQVRDTKDRPSAQYRTIFLKIPTPTKSKVHYWVDDKSEKMQTFAYNGSTHILDLEGVSDGFHILHVQAEDVSLSSPMTKLFIKIPQTEGVEKLLCLCSIDGETVKQEEVTNHDGVLNWSLDVSDITQGFHHILVQVITNSGAGSSLYEGFFLRDFTSAEMSSLKCVFSIDGEPHRTMAGSRGGDVFHFDLDVADIKDGLHNITYMLVGDNGVCTKSNSAYFWKTPLGGNGVTQYNYWLNDQTEKHEVVLKERTNPYNLITLLPVDKMPVRSSCFDFKVENGTPVIYAKNDIHFEFIDASGFVNVANAQYVDPTVSKSIEGITALLPTQTFTRPEENGIKWFKFDAEYGDSIALKSNQAASIQVFSASGKELYSVSGSNSVNFGGCHVFEDGTFYVAVHDVTGSAQNITLESKKIEKFCIFEYSPDRITSEGNVIMSVCGNGLEYVKSVKLTDGDITIAADTMIARSSEMMAAFCMNEDIASDKKLSLEVYFNNEIKNDSKTIILKDAITLEPVMAGNINVTITRENRVGDPYPIQIHIKNTGNLAYTAIPFGLAFDNVDKFDGCTFENFELLLSEERYIERDFFAYTDNLLGQGKKGLYIPMILPYLGPYEELVYTVGIKTKIAHANINAYAWAIEPWSESLKKYKSDSDRSNAPRKVLECTPTNLPLVHDLLDALSDFADALGLSTAPFDLAKIGIGAGEAIGGMQQGLTRAREDAVFDAYGFDPEMLGMSRDDFRMQFRYCPRSPQDIAASFSPIDLPDRQQAPKKASGRSTTNSMASGDCPHVDPTPVNPLIPGDPNEITGYLSESGGHYINTEVVNVGYDIEFENDPEIANAAAHHIVIRDTLDARFFDFDSFAPKTVKISGKEVELDGTYPFVKSLDMRPEINSIAEFRGDFDKQSGIATWDLIALDPMTMEPTDDIMQGILPVNTQDGNGIGNVTYTINLKTELADGTEIPNRASIVFDYNDAILTLVWTNTIDAVAPEGSVIDVTQHGDSAYIACDGSDERSGIWKYEVYAQPGAGASWLKVGECFADSAVIAYEVFDGIDYGFCVLAVDSAGNVEQKELLREMSLMPFSPGDVNGDQRVTISDAVGIVNLVLNTNTEGMNRRAADVNDDNTISIADAVIVVNMVTHASPLSAKTRDEEVWDVQFHIKAEVVEIGQTFELPIVLAGDTCDITALQMDVALPHGLSLVNAHTDINHIAVHAAQEDASERVALISLSNEILARPDVMTLQLRVDNDFEGGFIKIGNAELVTARLLSLHPRDAQVAVVLNGTDAIDWLEAEDQDAGTFTLQGSKATKSDHGVLIQNGQKNFIEKRNE